MQKKETTELSRKWLWQSREQIANKVRGQVIRAGEGVQEEEEQRSRGGSSRSKPQAGEASRRSKQEKQAGEARIAKVSSNRWSKQSGRQRGERLPEEDALDSVKGYDFPQRTAHRWMVQPPQLA